MTPDEKTALIQELHAKYPSATLSESSPDCEPDTFVIFRNAGRIEYNTYRQQREADATRFDADTNLAMVCVVYPDRPTLQTILDRLPAFASSLAVDIVHASGGLKSSVKKI